jgi:hypothetical protein
MKHFILNLAEGDPELAHARLDARRWPVASTERHRDALAPGDRALIFVAATLEFVGCAGIRTRFLDPMPADANTPAPAISGVLLDDVEHWPRGVPLHVAVQRIDPNRSNPYVQANAEGFRAGVVQITVGEYDIVVSLHDGDAPIES